MYSPLSEIYPERTFFFNCIDRSTQSVCSDKGSRFQGPTNMKYFITVLSTTVMWWD